MLKLYENPAMLTPEVDSVSELTGTWWVGYTKSRCEKAFAWEMLNRKIGYFLPMRKKIIFSGGRKRSVMLPLFTSYVFFCGMSHDRYTALTTNRLCHTIEVRNQERFTRELARIEQALLSKLPIDSYPQLPVGTHCRVISGPMLGSEGTIIERFDEKARMILEVTVLGQGVLIEIDADLLDTVQSGPW